MRRKILCACLLYTSTQSLADYRKKAYEEGTLIQDMSDNGYDVKLYTSSEYLNGVNQEAVSNTAGRCV